MDDNPYKAPQTDGNVPTTTRPPKPVQVPVAATLLSCSLAVGVLASLVDHLLLRAVWSDAVLLVLVFTFAFMALFIWLIASGRNWGRWIFLILFVLGFPGWLLMLADVFARSLLLGGLSVLQVLLQSIALWLLFTNPAARWYRGWTAVDHLRHTATFEGPPT